MGKFPTGTLINMASIFVGSLIGLMLRQVFPENIQTIAFQAVGLGILIIGIQMSVKLKDEMMLIFIFSLMIGAIVGEYMEIKEFLESCANWSKDNIQIGQQRFIEGLIAAFILFCASPITIVGPIEEGLTKKRELMLIKSGLDGVTAVALASVHGGIGVTLSIIPMFFIQGSISLLATRAKSTFTKNVISLISGVGGAILIALSIKMLGLSDIKVASLLPSLFIVVLFSYSYSKLKLKI